MKALGFALFETAIGPCAVAWNDRGIVGCSLPERDDTTLRARMLRRYSNATESVPPEAVARVIGRVQALLRGESADLSDVALDMDDIPELNRRVYEIAREIAPGTTVTYGEIAVRLGDKALSRAVGQALGSNPFPPIVPCHRVLSADGRMHGFSAPGGVATKLRMLRIEGWRAEEPSLFD